MHQAGGQRLSGVAVGRAGVRGFSPAALRRHRSAKHYALTELSSVSGVAAATIGAWETGRSRPSPSTLAAVAVALGVQVGDLAPVPESDLHLADLRFQVGLTQQELASAAGISKGIYPVIESGHREPTDQEVAALAAALSVEPELVATVWQRTRDVRLARLRSR
jgi:transcriptional regulator with XRE-family HTH domain